MVLLTTWNSNYILETVNSFDLLVISACLLSAFVTANLLIPEIIKITHNYDLHDSPDEARKIHQHRIPTFGGMAIFIGFSLSTLVWAISVQAHIQYLISSILVIVVVGMRDDFLPLSARYKLLGQFIASFFIMYFGEIRFSSLHGFLGIYELPIIWSYLITLFTIIVITNAFNLIDGINGLAGSIAILVFSTYGVWFYFHNNQIMTVVCFSLLGSVIGFLRYNFSNQIFMGDTGALLLGFLASATTIIFINENATKLPYQAFRFANPITIASCIMVYPLFDTLRVFVLRIIQKRSPFSPDRNHIHHLFLRIGFSHLQATGAICTINFIFIVLGIFSDAFANDNYMIPIIVSLAWILSLILAKWVNIFEKKETLTSSKSLKTAPKKA